MQITSNSHVVIENKPNEIITVANGVKPRSITIKNSPNVILENAVFRNQELGLKGSDYAFIKIENSPNAFIRDCGIFDCNPSNLSDEYKYVYIKHSPNTQIKRCSFTEKHNLGTVIAVYVDDKTAGDGRYIFHYNLFLNNRALGAAANQNGSECIRIYDSTRSMLSARAQIRFNWFQGCGSEGEPEIVSIKACDNYVDDNVLIDCLGGLTSRHGKRNTFTKNHIVNCPIGIRLIDSDHVARDNYIEGQRGANGFKGGIVLVNGQPNSAINGYFAADNAIVENNTINDSDREIVVTNGGKSELTIQPKNFKQINNHIDVSKKSTPFTIDKVGMNSVNVPIEEPEEPQQGEKSMGIWISESEIKALPTTGTAWSKVLADANSSWGTANLGDNNSMHDVKTLAGALVAVRNNDSAMRAKVVTALNSAVNNTSFHEALQLARGLQTYIIAADIIGHREPNFLKWVADMVVKDLRGHSGNGLLGTATNAPNNWGGHARASLAAAAIFLNRQDWKDKVVTAQKAMIGIPAPGNTMVYTDTNWHRGTPRAGINAVNAGEQLSGVLPEDYRRGGEYKWPPGETTYIGEGMQGLVVTAVILHRAGLLPFSAGDNAIVRALDAAFRASSAPEGDDTWITWVVNSYAGTKFPTLPANSGKNMGFTDWTHAQPVSTPPVEPEEPEEPPVEPEEPEEPPVEPEEPDGPSLVITGDAEAIDALQAIFELMQDTDLTSVIVTKNE